MDVTHPRLLDAEGIDSTLSEMSVFINHHSKRSTQLKSSTIVPSGNYNLYFHLTASIYKVRPAQFKA